MKHKRVMYHLMKTVQNMNLQSWRRQHSLQNWRRRQSHPRGDGPSTNWNEERIPSFQNWGKLMSCQQSLPVMLERGAGMNLARKRDPSQSSKGTTVPDTNYLDINRQLLTLAASKQEFSIRRYKPMIKKSIRGSWNQKKTHNVGIQSSQDMSTLKRTNNLLKKNRLLVENVLVRCPRVGRPTLGADVWPVESLCIIMIHRRIDELQIQNGLRQEFL